MHGVDSEKGCLHIVLPTQFNHLLLDVESAEEESSHPNYLELTIKPTQKKVTFEDPDDPDVGFNSQDAQQTRLDELEQAIKNAQDNMFNVVQYKLKPLDKSEFQIH